MVNNKTNHRAIRTDIGVQSVGNLADLDARSGFKFDIVSVSA